MMTTTEKIGLYLLMWGIAIWIVLIIEDVAIVWPLAAVLLANIGWLAFLFGGHRAI